MRKLTKVISGGQTGVDQAAQRAARDCGLKIGGWCPPARECEAGVIPPEFPLEETEQERSADAPDVPRSQRTEWNVRDSDGTLVIHDTGASHPPSPRFGVASSERATEDTGTMWTIECAKRYKRSLLVCHVDDPNATQRIVEWIASNSIRTLNVAGPSESNAPGIGDKAYALLMQIFTTRQSPANGRE
jgi:hypothetical protein